MTEKILEQERAYYRGYIDGMKWIIKYINQDTHCKRPITDEEWEQFFESIKESRGEE